LTPFSNYKKFEGCPSKHKFPVIYHRNLLFEGRRGSPQYHLFEAIKGGTNTRIVISGDGADELFGGYRRINEYDSQKSDVFHELTYYHLPRLDKLSMAHTLELRNPFFSANSFGGFGGSISTIKIPLGNCFCALIPPLMQYLRL